jgi:hypothetical protein
MRASTRRRARGTRYERPANRAHSIYSPLSLLRSRPQVRILLGALGKALQIALLSPAVSSTWERHMGLSWDRSKRAGALGGRLRARSRAPAPSLGAGLPGPQARAHALGGRPSGALGVRLRRGLRAAGARPANRKDGSDERERGGPFRRGLGHLRRPGRLRGGGRGAGLGSGPSRCAPPSQALRHDPVSPRYRRCIPTVRN